MVYRYFSRSINPLITILMKKFIAVFAFFAFASISMNAQNIGVRFGGGFGSDAEISYQTSSSTDRLEIDLGFNFANGNNRLGGAVIWQWVRPIENGFNWYYGIGAALGMRDDDNGADAFGVGVAGQLGVEYNFANAPFQLSLDVRPTLYVIPATTGGGSAAFGIRYRL